jgi:hypothetical protein
MRDFLMAAVASMHWLENGLLAAPRFAFGVSVSIRTMVLTQWKG